MAEYGVEPDEERVLGVALDGLGYGDDGTIWGGEFLLCGYADFERVGHFQPVAMPGGTQAILQPWRNAFAHLSASLGWDRVAGNFADLDLVAGLSAKPLEPMQQMIDKGLNSPLASSAGRLFDAVAAALGVCRDSVSYEGQAAIELEALARSHIGAVSSAGYPYDWNGRVLSWGPLWSALLNDLLDGIERGVVAARFHNGLASAVAEVTAGLCSSHAVQRVVLNGGVVQNRLLLEGVSKRLRRQGLEVLSPSKLPANDGGLSLGQAAIAAARFT